MLFARRVTSVALSLSGMKNVEAVAAYATAALPITAVAITLIRERCMLPPNSGYLAGLTCNGSMGESLTQRLQDLEPLEVRVLGRRLLDELAVRRVGREEPVRK